MIIRICTPKQGVGPVIGEAQAADQRLCTIPRIGVGPVIGTSGVIILYGTSGAIGYGTSGTIKY